MASSATSVAATPQSTAAAATATTTTGAITTTKASEYFAAERWSQFYNKDQAVGKDGTMPDASKLPAWESGSPCSMLVDAHAAGDLPKPGKALDIGCGNGMA